MKSKNGSVVQRNDFPTDNMCVTRSALVTDDWLTCQITGSFRWRFRTRRKQKRMCLQACPRMRSAGVTAGSYCEVLLPLLLANLTSLCPSWH